MQAETYISPKAIKRKSQTDRVGLFANEHIAIGEVVAIKSGHIIDTENCKKVVEKIGDYYNQLTDDLYISPITADEIPKYAMQINHSCEPNVGVFGQITFVALRDIQPGEELCYDYAMTTDHSYEFRCMCGTPSCRGVVTGEDWKRRDLQEKYGDHFATFILVKIHALTKR